MAYRKTKLFLFMAIGAVAMSLGAIVAGNARFGSSISPANFVTTIIVSAALFFIGGLFWAVVASALRKTD